MSLLLFCLALLRSANCVNGLTMPVEYSSRARVRAGLRRGLAVRLALRLRRRAGVRRRLGAGVRRAPRLAGGRAEGSRRVGRRPRQRRAMGAPEVDRGCAAGETEVERRLSRLG